MTESTFIEKILNVSDEELSVYAKECNDCASCGVWDKKGKIYSLLCEYAYWNNGAFMPAMNVIVVVALEFMKRNAKG